MTFCCFFASLRDLMTAAVQNLYRGLTNFGRPDSPRTMNSAEYSTLQGLNAISSQLGSMSIERINANSLSAVPKVVPEDIFESEYQLVQSDECPICFEDLINDQDKKQCKKCKHSFHDFCLQAWFKTGHLSCPLCRHCETVKPNCLPNQAATTLLLQHFPMTSWNQPPYTMSVLLRDLRSF